MKQRVITGLALVAGVIFFLSVAGIPLLLMCALISVIAAKEIIDVINKDKALPLAVQILVYLFTYTVPCHCKRSSYFESFLPYVVSNLFISYRFGPSNDNENKYISTPLNTVAILASTITIATLSSFEDIK